MRNYALRTLLIGLCVLAMTVSFSDTGNAGQKELKIGMLGVMSGPAASWGLVNKYCTIATARMYNEKGGVEIDGEKYKIKVISIDDKNDPKLAVAGAERLIYQDHVKYMIGPNCNPTAASIVPVLEAGGAMNIAYSFLKKIYSAPHHNSILGMVASYQVSPMILKYLQSKGVKTISFFTWNVSDGFVIRDPTIKACQELGIKILSKDVTYETGTTDFFPQMSKIVPGNPDAIAFCGPSAADSPLIIKAARELGYKGIIFTQNAQDVRPLREVAGKYADGYICLGGASTPEIRSKYMENFIKVYNSVAGEWNDEAGTKVYALEMILATLKTAGKGALTDISLFKKAIPKVAVKNPFLKEDKLLRYTGKKWYGQLRQIGLPVVWNEFHNGDFKTLFVKPLD
jgi:branched-chain amino acid transport system substrate-binding protein